jgi:uncharacterized membrane protein (DUF485 family)
VSSVTATRPGRSGGSGYEAVRASRDFWTLRRRFSSFVVPVCVLFILWYFLFVIIAVFAPGFMRISAFGDVNAGCASAGATASLITDPHVNFAFFPLNTPGSCPSRWLSSLAGWARSPTAPRQIGEIRGRPTVYI